MCYILLFCPHWGSGSHVLVCLFPFVRCASLCPPLHPSSSPPSLFLTVLLALVPESQSRCGRHTMVIPLLMNPISDHHHLPPSPLPTLYPLPPLFLSLSSCVVRADVMDTRLSVSVSVLINITSVIPRAQPLCGACPLFSLSEACVLELGGGPVGWALDRWLLSVL